MHLGKLGAGRVAAEVACTAEASNVYALAVSESALRGEVAQLFQHVGENEEEVAGLCQEPEFKVKDVLFEPYGLQARLDSRASQLSGVCN